MNSGLPSLTAQAVAARRLSFPRLAAPYGRPADEDRLARDVAGSVPPEPEGFLTRHLAGRTAFFDRVVVRCLQSPITQVVILASGYDGRALRYAKPGVCWFEVDHPLTQRDKRDRLERLGLPVPHVAFAAADFTTDDVAAALAEAGHDAAIPTLFLCEGLAVYLEPVVLELLLRAIRSRAAPDSRLAISLSAATATAEFAESRRRFEASVAALGEPARNGLTANSAAPIFTATGWRELDHPPGSVSRERARGAGFVVAAPV